MTTIFFIESVNPFSNESMPEEQRPVKRLISSTIPTKQRPREAIWRVALRRQQPTVLDAKQNCELLGQLREINRNAP